MTNQEAAREFEDTLGLDSCLIGVKYSKESDPKGDTERKLAPCEAIDAVRREKVVVNLSPENCNCIGGKYYLGLAPVPREQILRVVMDVHKMFASEQLAQEFLDGGEAISWSWLLYPRCLGNLTSFYQYVMPSKRTGLLAFSCTRDSNLSPIISSVPGAHR